jgi:hypothetical protein
LLCVCVCVCVYYSLLMPFPWKHNFHVYTQVAALYSHRLTDADVTHYCSSEEGGKNSKEITSLNFSCQFSFGVGGGGGGGVMLIVCRCCCSSVKVWFGVRDFGCIIIEINETAFKHNKHCNTVASRGNESECRTHWLLGRLNLSKPCHFKGSAPTALSNSLSICIRNYSYKPPCNCHSVIFLDPFAKLLKAALTFVITVCPSAWNNSGPTGQSFMIFEHFSKICRENSSFVKIWQ